MANNGQQDGKALNERPRRDPSRYSKDYNKLNTGHTHEEVSNTQEHVNQINMSVNAKTLEYKTQANKDKDKLEDKARLLDNEIDEVEDAIEKETRIKRNEAYHIAVQPTIEANMDVEKAQEIKDRQEEMLKQNRTSADMLESLLYRREVLTQERIKIGKIISDKEAKDKEHELITAQFYLEEEEKRIEIVERELMIKQRGKQLLERRRQAEKAMQQWEQKQAETVEVNKSEEAIGHAGEWEDKVQRGATSEADMTNLTAGAKKTKARKNSKAGKKKTTQSIPNIGTEEVSEGRSETMTASQLKIKELEQKIKEKEQFISSRKPFTASQIKIAKLERKLAEKEHQAKLTASQQRIMELEKQLAEKQKEIDDTRLQQGIPKLKAMGLIHASVPDDGKFRQPQKPNNNELKRLKELQGQKPTRNRLCNQQGWRRRY